MAAGRYGGYRDYEVRDREVDSEASRRRENHLDRYRKRDRDRSAVLDLGARVRDRPGDVKKRESLNGYHHHHRSRSPMVNGSYSSSGSGDEQKKIQLLGRSVDREPGELSSGSGSDDSGTPLQHIKENGVRSGQEDNSLPSPSKKRKFSPIVWDRDDAKQSSTIIPISRKEAAEPVTLPLPPPPPLPLPQVDVPSDLVVGAQLSMEQPYDASLVDPMVSIDSPHARQFGDADKGPIQMEEDDEEYHMTRNISASRWADGNNSFDDYEDEQEVVAKKKSISPADTLDRRWHKKASPELGEVVRDGSGGASSKSSDSRGEGGVEYEEMVVDQYEVVGDNDVSDHLSDASFENEDDRDRTCEAVQHPPQRCINMLQGCRSVDEFERLNKINEGTYGVVYRARDKKTGEIVALKKVKMEKEREGFPLTSLREINILLSFHHPSIVDVKEVVVGSSLDSIFMVMEYMEHDLKGLMETMKQPYSQSEVKCLMLQLLEGVKYLHDNWVLHRDLKTSNLLLNNCGELKICDFGLSRQYGSPLKPYTQLVVTLWYRAPELLLGAKEYSTAIDMWSLGCIMAELLAKEPLFNGKTEFDQLDKIFRILGTPNEKIWPGFGKLPRVKVNFVKQPYNRLREKFPPTSFSGRPTLSEAGFDLLNKLLTYDPEKRITAEAALKHDWFREVPLPKSKDFMPTFPAQNAHDRRLRRITKSPDPLEEQRIRELQQGELGTRSLFD
ncbi:cyclin-dependent kinase G-2 [Typha angustifolia]|uniref:cyclin-dependent kinase G-2 n=1 Tax=Typha angustifolia TaxID=59011 RepID=UPI003C2DA60D